MIARKSNVSIALVFFLFSCCVGCASTSQPILYPNETYHSKGKVKAESDVQYCLDLGDKYVKEPDKYAELAKSGVLGGAVGAGTGALAGVIVRGNVGRSVGAGAAVGAIVSVLGELMTSDKHTPSYQRFVEHCLHKEGYEITGWN